MQTANEIQSAIKNIKYYSQRIRELASQQFEIDYKLGEQLGINSEPGSLRFDSLGAIGAGTSWIEAYCDNISVNLKAAAEQEKKLYKPEEEDES